MTRTQEREQAFILIFESEFQDGAASDLIAAARETMNWADSAYVDKTVSEVMEKKAEIDASFAAFLKKGWSIDRLAKVPLALLRLAVYEITSSDDVPASVAINEAVELCKKYATESDAAYLNGVLGSFVRAGEAE